MSNALPTESFGLPSILAFVVFFPVFGAQFRIALHSDPLSSAYSVQFFFPCGSDLMQQ